MTKTVAFMPVRLNSKRVPEKSIKPLAGRPLLCWGLETLDKLDIPLYLYASCTKELKKTLDFKPQNIVFLERPESLDGDETKGIDIYNHFRKEVPADIYLLTHCTSPFIKKETYQKTIDLVASGQYDSALTALRVQTFCWHKGKQLNFSLPRPRTQDLEPVFVETSGAYCYRGDVLDSNSRTGPNCAVVEVSRLESVDIDTLEEFELAKMLALRRRTH